MVKAIVFCYKGRYKCKETSDSADEIAVNCKRMSRRACNRNNPTVERLATLFRCVLMSCRERPLFFARSQTMRPSTCTSAGANSGTKSSTTPSRLAFRSGLNLLYPAKRSAAPVVWFLGNQPERRRGAATMTGCLSSLSRISRRPDYALIRERDVLPESPRQLIVARATLKFHGGVY
jgi:hypothetical protein